VLILQEFSVFAGRKRKGINRWGALFAFFALYLQFVVPIGYAVAASQPTDEGLFGKAIICSSYGVKYVDLATGEEVFGSTDDIGAKCPICISLDLGSATLQPPLNDFKFQLSSTGTTAFLPRSQGDWMNVPSDYSSRAPPKQV
jgi:hypothetical protein